MLAVLGGQIATLDAQIAELETQMRAAHKANPLSRLLEQIPGIGPISALSLALTIDPAQFRSGRHLAAALGLTPREHSTGGKQRMGGISRAGDERLRRLLVVGATAVIRQAAAGRGKASAWWLNLLQRRPRKVVAVALANKMARVAWAMMTSGEAYRAAEAPTGLGPDRASMPRRQEVQEQRDDNRSNRRTRSPRGFQWRFDAVSLFGAGSRIPSGPAARCRTNRPDT